MLLQATFSTSGKKPCTEVVCHGDPSCQAPSVQRGEQDQIPCRLSTRIKAHIRAAPTLLGYHDSFSIVHVALTTNAIPSTTVSREVHAPFSSLTFVAVAAKTVPHATTWTLSSRITFAAESESAPCWTVIATPSAFWRLLSPAAISCSSSSVIRSPSSLATRFRFLNEILPVSSSSNKRKAFRISSLGSRFNILCVIILRNSSYSIVPLPSSSTSEIIF